VELPYPVRGSDPVTTWWLELITVWELLAISLVLLVSSYLLLNLSVALFRRSPAGRYAKNGEFPFVSVVIPVYNEPAEIVRATLASWKAVRYTDFEILVADDSTVPLDLTDLGVRSIRRANRAGFKGGAMRNAFQQLDPRSRWMLVFDADFVVDPDVLVRFSEHYAPEVGGIQGCMSMGGNPAPTFLTRYSESFHAVADTLLTGRYRMKGFVGVQGTVQAYNVDAIRAIGGIAPYSTANEDLDTSFRLRKAGWKIVYDPKIGGRGIAPDRLGVFFTQLTRWTSTTVREYRRHWWSFVRSPHVPWTEKIDSVLFLLTWTIALAVTPTLAFIPWVLLYVHLIPLWLSIAITLLPLPLFMLPALRGSTVKLGAIGWLGYYTLLLPGYFVMFRASLLGLFTDPGFARTPKTATSPTPRPARPGLESGHLSAVQRMLCTSCAAPLGSREVLFYAVGAPEVQAVECRRCLGRSEWPDVPRIRPTPG
jgi:cellulose synthase/poly-beta-1,6-N-acetylglucosamine synthase-like glycosyltransferase